MAGEASAQRSANASRARAMGVLTMSGVARRPAGSGVVVFADQCGGVEVADTRSEWV